MIKEDVEKVLRSLWQEDKGQNPEHRICYNKALQDVQVAIDSLPEEPVTVSEDLKDAAQQYAKYTAAPPSDVAYHFVSGANWQKEQMMKEAVEGVYDCDDDNSWIEFKGWAESTSEAGCKVKVIIVKETEK